MSETNYKDMQYDGLVAAKNKIINKIRELSKSIDGASNEENQEVIAEMKTRAVTISAEINNRQKELNTLEAKLKEISKDNMVAIYQKLQLIKLVKIKNAERLYIDRETGYLWYKAPEKMNYSDANKFCQNLNLYGLKNWGLAEKEKLQKIHNNFEGQKWIQIYKGGYEYTHIHSNGDVDHGEEGNSMTVLALSEEFANSSFVASDVAYASKDKYEKVKLFLYFLVEKEWIPDLEDEKLNASLDLFFRRERLYRDLTTLNEQIEKQEGPLRGIRSDFNFKGRLKPYDLEEIGGSIITYAQATSQWIDDYMSDIEDLVNNEEKFIDEMVGVTILFEKTLKKYDKIEILSKRNQFINNNFSNNIELLKTNLLSYKNQAQEILNEIANTTDFKKLKLIEDTDRPTFITIAESTTNLVKNTLRKMEWLKKNISLVDEIVNKNENFCNDYEIFVTKLKNDFIKECKDNSIKETLYSKWLASWENERNLIESKILPLLELAINYNLKIDILLTIIDKIEKYKKDIDDIYINKRLSIYQKYAFVPGGELQAEFEENSEKFKVVEEFQKGFEDIIFSLDKSEIKILLSKWAKEWYNDKITECLGIIEKNSIEEKITKDVLERFRKIGQKNMETYLIDIKAYKKHKEELEKEYHSIMFKMRSEITQK